MKILIAHNHYGRFPQGGESNVMNAEARLLEEQGHEVLKYERSNAEVKEGGSLWEKFKAFRDVAWSRESYDDMTRVIRAFRPDIVHVHNFWFRLTPAILQAAKDRQVKTVRTLHNYGLLCPAGHFLSQKRVCEACLPGRPYHILLQGCEKNIPRLCIMLRQALNTRKLHGHAGWTDGYIALSEFARRKFITGGLPESKIHTKPNFMEDPLNGGQPDGNGNGAVFVGRLSAEKGLEHLLEAWRGIQYPLTIVGDGPLYGNLVKKAGRNVTFLGPKRHEEVLDVVRKAAMLVFPSICYEGFPLVLLEAMALGKAIIATDLGARREMITHGAHGLLYRAGDVTALRDNVRLLMENPALPSRLGREARTKYLACYTGRQNYEILIGIYNRVLSGE